MDPLESIFSESSRQLRRFDRALAALEQLEAAAREKPVPSAAVIATLGVVRSATFRLRDRLVPKASRHDPELGSVLMEELDGRYAAAKARVRELFGPQYYVVHHRRAL